ncbi:DUF1353 domain-containing protein [Thiomicrorhabdus cannonii]|uniref:DUF1353 domain-containing protein n=1 Tax=Thiomicrorhabdus cannonii TaxID=2748011 RepID=UPI0015B8B85A|nr:DUF1353 domain-containing protein [Thiomicrorhabdus cannonii]
MTPSGVFVEVLLPSNWWQRPRYQLTQPINCAGHTVPAGFISDGATVPRILWPIFPPIGRYLKATLVHDYYLQQGIDRKTADHHFKHCLIALDVEPWRVHAMYYAVRVYGMFTVQQRKV